MNVGKRIIRTIRLEAVKQLGHLNVIEPTKKVERYFVARRIAELRTVLNAANAAGGTYGHTRTVVAKIDLVLVVNPVKALTRDMSRRKQVFLGAACFKILFTAPLMQ